MQYNKQKPKIDTYQWHPHFVWGSVELNGQTQDWHGAYKVKTGVWVCFQTIERQHDPEDPFKWGWQYRLPLTIEEAEAERAAAERAAEGGCGAFGGLCDSNYRYGR